MNEGKCNFCGESFRNRQAVRAHLRHSLPIGRPVPEADDLQAGVDPGDSAQPAAGATSSVTRN